MARVASFATLLRLIDTETNKGAIPLIIQPHDFPDHDAVASAFGLQRLLEVHGYATQILHRGELRSHSLVSMIHSFHIPLIQIQKEKQESITVNSPCIIIDGSPNNANARPLTKNLLGVIDHHPNPGILGCSFQDIRTSYGACSSIIADYWDEAGTVPDRDTATTLLLGIQIDTDFLSRRVSPADLNAHHRLFFRADWQFATRLARSSLSIQDLPTFSRAIQQARIQRGLFFTVLSEDCSQELISIMADFFLRFKEIRLSVITETGGETCHISVRSRSPEISAAALIKRALAGIGEGGGHDHMAGGTIYTSLYPGEEQLFKRFLEALETIEENQ
ncbi:MAG TPA: DHHA1 domain-containing protein [Termitinemataceae bacterium]|uniref:DHH family phosphoesterase n=1 Tax=Treponema sp. J25 TaxID=2094121 RepID=UPI0010501A48|nr:DHHA1 domain-containing protein [Treponema sp. J25]TCW61688.1 DHH family phosphoesterase [Treponema sp. J25]HOJ98011.1 DHHA1 domain-containing protein [Termitinemataceae bacterium]HOM22258.1 DHHA1 domain-containing protein [Termitinemataceae bacterium]HPP99320.1 DHHA1 domain-containing protein [Termitinemataceae bacterium]